MIIDGYPVMDGIKEDSLEYFPSLLLENIKNTLNLTPCA
jgi:hypothetical protein